MNACSKLTDSICQEVADFFKHFMLQRYIFSVGTRWHKTITSLSNACVKSTAKTFKEGIRKTAKQQIKVPLGVNETAEWCNKSVSEPRPNGALQLCFDPVKTNQTLIRQLYRGPTLNDVLPNSSTHNALY